MLPLTLSNHLGPGKSGAYPHTRPCRPASSRHHIGLGAGMTRRAFGRVCASTAEERVVDSLHTQPCSSHGPNPLVSYAKLLFLTGAMAAAMLVEKKPVLAAAGPQPIHTVQDSSTSSGRSVWRKLTSATLAPVHAMDRLLFPDEPITLISSKSSSQQENQQHPEAPAAAASEPINPAPPSAATAVAVPVEDAAPAKQQQSETAFTAPLDQTSTADAPAAATSDVTLVTDSATDSSTPQHSSKVSPAATVSHQLSQAGARVCFGLTQLSQSLAAPNWPAESVALGGVSRLPASLAGEGADEASTAALARQLVKGGYALTGLVVAIIAWQLAASVPVGSRPIRIVQKTGKVSGTASTAWQSNSISGSSIITAASTSPVPEMAVEPASHPLDSVTTSSDEDQQQQQQQQLLQVSTPAAASAPLPVVVLTPDDVLPPELEGRQVVGPVCLWVPSLSPASHAHFSAAAVAAAAATADALAAEGDAMKAAASVAPIQLDEPVSHMTALAAAAKGHEVIQAAAEAAVAAVESEQQADSVVSAQQQHDNADAGDVAVTEGQVAAASAEDDGPLFRVDLADGAYHGSSSSSVQAADLAATIEGSLAAEAVREALVAESCAAAAAVAAERAQAATHLIEQAIAEHLAQSIAASHTPFAEPDSSSPEVAVGGAAAAVPAEELDADAASLLIAEAKAAEAAAAMAAMRAAVAADSEPAVSWPDELGPSAAAAATVVPFAAPAQGYEVMLAREPEQEAPAEAGVAAAEEPAAADTEPNVEQLVAEAKAAEAAALEAEAARAAAAAAVARVAAARAAKAEVLAGPDAKQLAAEAKAAEGAASAAEAARVAAAAAVARVAAARAQAGAIAEPDAQQLAAEAEAAEAAALEAEVARVAAADAVARVAAARAAQAEVIAEAIAAEAAAFAAEAASGAADAAAAADSSAGDAADLVKGFICGGAHSSFPQEEDASNRSSRRSSSSSRLEPGSSYTISWVVRDDPDALAHLTSLAAALGHPAILSGPDSSSSDAEAQPADAAEDVLKLIDTTTALNLASAAAEPELSITAGISSDSLPDSAAADADADAFKDEFPVPAVDSVTPAAPPTAAPAADVKQQVIAAPLADVLDIASRLQMQAASETAVQQALERVVLIYRSRQAAKTTTVVASSSAAAAGPVHASKQSTAAAVVSSNGSSSSSKYQGLACQLGVSDVALALALAALDEPSPSSSSSSPRGSKTSSTDAPSAAEPQEPSRQSDSAPAKAATATTVLPAAAVAAATSSPAQPRLAGPPADAAGIARAADEPVADKAVTKMQSSGDPYLTVAEALSSTASGSSSSQSRAHADDGSSSTAVTEVGQRSSLEDSPAKSRHAMRNAAADVDEGFTIEVEVVPTPAGKGGSSRSAGSGTKQAAGEPSAALPDTSAAAADADAVKAGQEQHVEASFTADQASSFEVAVERPGALSGSNSQGASVPQDTGKLQRKGPIGFPSSGKGFGRLTGPSNKQQLYNKPASVSATSSRPPYFRHGSGLLHAHRQPSPLWSMKAAAGRKHPRSWSEWHAAKAQEAAAAAAQSGAQAAATTSEATQPQLKAASPAESAAASPTSIPIEWLATSSTEKRQQLKQRAGAILDEQQQQTKPANVESSSSENTGASLKSGTASKDTSVSSSNNGVQKPAPGAAAATGTLGLEQAPVGWGRSVKSAAAAPSKAAQQGSPNGISNKAGSSAEAKPLASASPTAAEAAVGAQAPKGAPAGGDQPGKNAGAAKPAQQRTAISSSCKAGSKGVQAKPESWTAVSSKLSRELESELAGLLTSAASRLDAEMAAAYSTPEVTLIPAAKPPAAKAPTNSPQQAGKEEDAVKKQQQLLPDQHKDAGAAATNKKQLGEKVQGSAAAPAAAGSLDEKMSAAYSMPEIILLPPAKPSRKQQLPGVGPASSKGQQDLPTKAAPSTIDDL